MSGATPRLAALARAVDALTLAAGELRAAHALPAARPVHVDDLDPAAAAFWAVTLARSIDLLARVEADAWAARVTREREAACLRGAAPGDRCGPAAGCGVCGA